MKRLLALGIAVAFTAALAGFAAAQTPAPAPAPAPMKADKGEMKKMPAKNANGAVKSASADSVVVAGKEKVKGSKEMKDVEWTFGVDAKTAIKKGGKSITAADLKAGDPVHVRYMEHDGKAVATAINVRPAKKTAANPCAGKPADKK
ncbi:MAG: hypothetical protein HY616_00105 [Candidatus Rokubacteria bacterium]|nr:hypothetical protein [Candidatus Rokubacteria bacterium]MBI2016745.1 hypothetical protein [Candidatus Rokubacteria bacterium]MBI4253450.1 hypothetical protein [Candidatus Rokubacteria bacterium]